MTPQSTKLLGAAWAAALAACVSFDPSAPGGPEIAGTYDATVITRIENVLEVRTDTFAAALTLGRTGPHGRFAGTYRIAQADSGPVDGEFLSRDGRLLVTTLGDPPKPIAGVAYIRALYSWCEFPLLGMPPLTGRLTGDTLRITAQASLPCLYDLGVPVRPHTELSLSLTAVR
jgi:hypothetical protein